MDQLFVVTHPEPLALEVRALEDAVTPEGTVALGYYYQGSVLARGVVAEDAVEAITSLLRAPVSVALAATADELGNIDARVCLVLPLGRAPGEDEDEPDEPWKQSVPSPPIELEGEGADDEDGDAPRLALLPIGNVVRNVAQRRSTDVGEDVRDMLRNLLAGHGRDAVQKAIDDLLDSI